MDSPFPAGPGVRGTYLREIPTDAVPDNDWPLHVAMLDHGSPGASGSNFIENCPDPDAQFLHFTIWDIIHQCIRDLKNTTNRCWKGKAQDTIVTSSYNWSLNYKPYHSKEWSRHKAELLNGYLGCHDCDSPDFRRYAGRIAWGFNIPYDGTHDAAQRVFDKLHELKSFLHSGVRGSDP